MKSRALWIVRPGVCELREVELAPPAAGATLLRMLASGISRGTEALVFAGRVPPSQYAAMRAPLMEGDFPGPVKYGYCAVAATPEGERVFVLHPHQDVFLAPQHLCIPVPQHVPSHRAVLAANMETALNIVWDAAPLPGERVLVVGAGVVGLLTAWLLARLPGCTVTVLDVDAAREAPARLLGCRFADPGAAPAEQELIVHASATEAGLRTALACAAFEARIIEASWFGDAAPALPLGEAFHAKRLRLIASQVAAVAPALRGRRTHAQRLALALDLLDDPRLDALLEQPVPFAALAERYPTLLRGGLCHVVTY
jgi:NADPH:quinone reductase-like Zn-dependent oxidoreductase